MRAAVLTRRSWIEILEQKIPPTDGDEVRVRIKAGGICGSDIHYFQHYKMGDFPVREPFILGHEAAGVVETVGRNVKDLKNGDLVAVNPSHPCKNCSYCFSGRELLCANMRFLGSSRKSPIFKECSLRVLLQNDHNALNYLQISLHIMPLSQNHSRLPCMLFRMLAP